MKEKVWRWRLKGSQRYELVQRFYWLSELEPERTLMHGTNARALRDLLGSILLIAMTAEYS